VKVSAAKMASKRRRTAEAFGDLRRPQQTNKSKELVELFNKLQLEDMSAGLKQNLTRKKFFSKV
jgi:hypothetical protein